MIAAIGLALRLTYILVPALRPDLGYDGTWYALQAGTIGEGVGYVDPQRFFSLQGAFATAHFAPLWPALLSIPYDLGLGGQISYRVTGALIGTVTVVLTASLGRTLVSARAGLLAATIVAVSPFMIAADGSLMAESLFTALVTAAVLVGVKARRTRRIIWFAACCLLLGLATLTRGDGLLVALILVSVVAWGAADAWAPRMARLCLAVVIVAAVLTPWAVRNDEALGEPLILSSNFGPLVAGANCDQAYAGSGLAGWQSVCARAAGQRSDPELVRSDAQRDAGLEYVRDHWPRAAGVAVLRVVRGWGFWNPATLIDAEAVESRTGWVQAIGWVASLVLLGAAAVGTVTLLRSRAEIGELLAVVAAATLVLATSWGNQRFRLVATPELAVLAAVPLLALWDRRRGVATPVAD